MTRRFSPSPARTHFDAMRRLLCIGTGALVLFAAVQVANLFPGPLSGIVSAAANAVSLDLSPSAYRQLLDRRFLSSIDGDRP